MFEPTYAQIIMSKSRQTLLKNGNISKGQKRLNKILDGITNMLNVEYFKEYFIAGYYLDTAILSLKTGIEYDGHNNHFAKNKTYDLLRDCKLIERGWRILRIDTDAMFSERIGSDIWKFIHSNEVRKCIGKRYKQ